MSGEMEGWHWRNTMKTVRFFKFDYRAGFTLMLVLMHFRYWTLTFAVVVNVAFWLLERKGLSLPAALRAGRLWILGSYRPAVNWTVRRRLKDTGSG